MIVEAQFREHFQLAHATPQYAALLAAVPTELVASSERLAGLVALLSAAVEKAFAEQALPLPPWRRRKSVLSKWGLDERSVPGERGSRCTCMCTVEKCAGLSVVPARWLSAHGARFGFRVSLWGRLLSAPTAGVSVLLSTVSAVHDAGLFNTREASNTDRWQVVDATCIALLQVTRRCSVRPTSVRGGRCSCRCRSRARCAIRCAAPPPTRPPLRRRHAPSHASPLHPARAHPVVVMGQMMFASPMLCFDHHACVCTGVWVRLCLQAHHWAS